MKKIFILIAGFIIASPLIGQLSTYNWPLEDGEAILSDKYKAYVKHGKGEEQELEVLMSKAIYDGDYRADKVKGRTFSFVNVSYDDFTGEGLTFRIEKIFGSSSTEVEVVPESYEINNTVSGDGMETSFSIDENRKYVSINFVDTDNQVIVSPQTWIKHMMCIFIDPAEKNPPLQSDQGVVVYSKSTTPDKLINAETIYFPAGFYNLQDYEYTSSLITGKGQLNLDKGKNIYIEGGAFVEGHILASGSNSKISGRGILSGRKYIWENSSNFDGYDVPAMIKLGTNSTIEGITYMDAPFHGIAGGAKNLIENVKYNGWHCNNDAIRVANGSIVRNCFLRAVDDFFYNFNIHVHNCVLWAGHNGSILTYGWGSAEGSTYNSGSSIIENIDIINPEWASLGNNNGILMSNTGYEYKPHNYGTGTTTTIMRNIRVEGSIPAITNLKPNSDNDGIPIAGKVKVNNVGYLGDAILENITIEGQFEKSRIKGGLDVAYDGTANYYTQNIVFRNIKIAGVCVDNNNKTNYFDIEEETTKDIVFDSCTSNYTITAANVDNGTINPDGAILIPEGSDYTFTIDPDEGYMVEDLIIDGISQGSLLKYTFSNVNENHSVTASFIKAEFPYLYLLNRLYTGVLATVDGNANFNVTLDANVEDASWGLIDAGNNSYYIESVAFPGKYITVTSENSFILSKTQNDSAKWHINYTDNGWFYLESILTGKRIKSTDGNAGIDMTDDTGYRVQWNIIASDYAAPQETVTISALNGTGGSISPNGMIDVEKNSSKSFSIKANKGFVLDDVLVDDVSQGAVDSYTFFDLSENHKIVANFSKLISYTITASATSGGSISPKGEIKAYEGTEHVFTFLPDPGFEITDVIVDNSSLGKQSTYTFENLKASHTILAEFSSITSSSDRPIEGGNINIYPNPAKEWFTISGIEKGTEIVVSDLTGKRCFILTSQDCYAGISTSTLKSGLYFIQMTFNKKISTKKLVVR